MNAVFTIVLTYTSSKSRKNCLTTLHQNIKTKKVRHTIKKFVPAAVNCQRQERKLLFKLPL
jgi:hypothetical protein